MKKYSQRLNIVMLICVSISEYAAGQQMKPVDGFMEPHQKGRYSSMMQGGWKYWDKDYLVTWAPDGISLDISKDKPAVMLFDRTGQAKEAYFWLDGASRVGVSYAAVTRSGKVVVSGGSRNKEGAVAFYIGEISAGHQRVIRTSPFAPVYTCSGEDDTVWAYGFDRDNEGNRVASGPMLRQFSFDKGQLKATLLISQLSSGWELPEGSYPGQVSMRCNSNVLAIYNARANELVRLDFKSNALTIAKVDPLPDPSKIRITGFALTDSGDVFASFHDRSKSQPLSGLFQLVFDDAGNGRWTAVPGTVGPYRHGSPIGRLLGADGTSLVHTRDADDDVYWSHYHRP